MTLVSNTGYPSCLQSLPYNPLSPYTHLESQNFCTVIFNFIYISDLGFTTDLSWESSFHLSAYGPRPRPAHSSPKRWVNQIAAYISILSFYPNHIKLFQTHFSAIDLWAILVHLKLSLTAAHLQHAICEHKAYENGGKVPRPYIINSVLYLSTSMRVHFLSSG